MNALDHPNSVLQRLIVDGEMALIGRRVSQDTDYILPLVAAVDRLRKAPVDRERCIDDCTWIFAQALYGCENALRAYAPEKAARFQRVLGALMPDIREQFARAIEQARRPTV